VVAATIEEALETKSEYYTTYRFRRADGAERWAEAFGKIVFAGNGTPEKLAGVLSGFTDRNALKKSISNCCAASMRRVAKLRPRNRTKDEFLATLSHELRTPLNANRRLAGMLRTARSTTRAQSTQLRIIDRNAKVQAQLIEDILMCPHCQRQGAAGSQTG